MADVNRRRGLALRGAAPAALTAGAGRPVALGGDADDIAAFFPTAYRDAGPGAYGGRSYGGNVSFTPDSANREIVRERRQAVINAREIDRNNTMVRAGITKRAVDMVGANLRLQAAPNYSALGLSADWADEFSETWENEFSLWGDDPRKLGDAARHSNFGPMMLETCRNTYGADGEALLIIRYDETRQRKYRARCASFVEAVDSDRLSNPATLQDSRTLCQGRQLDNYGAYEGLWISIAHPSDPNGQMEWSYVPRETARGRPVGVHWFPKYRAGAQRAMPAIIGSLRDVRMLDRFDQKVLEKAVLSAFMSIFIKTDATSAEALAKLSPAPAKAGDPMLAAMDARFGLYEDLNAEGQAIPVLAPGDEVAIETPKTTDSGFDSFRFAFERKFASMLGLSYARFSNDYSKTSFASIRAEFIDSWRMTYADRYQFGSSVPTQVALAHLEEMIITGRIVLPPGAPDFYDEMTAYAQCEMRGPGMGWVDPVKDVTAAGMRISGGFSTPQAEAAAAGSDFRDNVDAIAQANAYAARKGVRLEYGASSVQTRKDEEIGPDGEIIDPNAGSGGAGSSDPPEPAAPPADKPKDKPE
jgi:lambda family phage portal protein